MKNSSSHRTSGLKRPTGTSSWKRTTRSKMESSFWETPFWTRRLDHLLIFPRLLYQSKRKNSNWNGWTMRLERKPIWPENWTEIRIWSIRKKWRRSMSTESRQWQRWNRFTKKSLISKGSYSTQVWKNRILISKTSAKCQVRSKALTRSIFIIRNRSPNTKGLIQLTTNQRFWIRAKRRRSMCRSRRPSRIIWLSSTIIWGWGMAWGKIRLKKRGQRSRRNSERSHRWQILCLRIRINLYRRACRSETKISLLLLRRVLPLAEDQARKQVWSRLVP